MQNTEPMEACQNGKIYHLGHGREKLESIPLQDAKTKDWSKSRLILIPIHSSVVPPSLSDNKKKARSGNLKDMPSCYEEVVEKICSKCGWLCKILWRNVQLVESRFESRFRPHVRCSDACFFQFHTMQAPILDDLNVTLALVHHLEIAKDSDSSNKESINKHEQIIAFIYVQSQEEETRQVEENTEDSVMRIYQHVIKFYTEEENCESSGLTPMLFIAALLKWYGFQVKDAVTEGFDKLIEIDRLLITQDKNLPYSNLRTQSERCFWLNQELITLNKKLTGLRSRANYVAESARSLKSDESTMKKYIEDEIGQNQHFTPEKDFTENIKRIVSKLESSKFVRRDNDKLDMIGRAMQQYQTDIKSLKAHLAINIGLVSNLYAQLQSEEAARDSTNMLIISTLGAVLLPMTFTAIFLTTPIFEFGEHFRDTTFRPLPLILFWVISFSLTGCGLLVKGFHWWRMKVRKQDGEKEDQDGKKEGKKDPPQTHADPLKENWWRKFETPLFMPQHMDRGKRKRTGGLAEKG